MNHDRHDLVEELANARDYIDTLEKTCIKLKNVIELLKEEDLYYQEADYDLEDNLELSYYNFNVDDFIKEHLGEIIEFEEE